MGEGRGGQRLATSGRRTNHCATNATEATNAARESRTRRKSRTPRSGSVHEMKRQQAKHP